MLDLIRACDTAEYGEPDTDMQDLLYDWQQADLDQDALLVEDTAGEVIAYGAVIPYRDGLRLDLYLHPDGRADNLKAGLLADLGTAHPGPLGGGSRIAQRPTSDPPGPQQCRRS